MINKVVWLIFIVVIVNTCTFSQKRLPKKNLLRTPINRLTRMAAEFTQHAFYLDGSSIRFLTSSE